MNTTRPTNSFKFSDSVSWPDITLSGEKAPQITDARFQRQDANARQVAGTHYQTQNLIPQHWDLAVAYKWDFFQYQITKYVMRWKTKHQTSAAKLEDLKKAAHFIQKYIEEVEAGRWTDDPPPTFLSADKDAEHPTAQGYVNQ